jgi:hypothetical protein
MEKPVRTLIIVAASSVRTRIAALAMLGAAGVLSGCQSTQTVWALDTGGNPDPIQFNRDAAGCHGGAMAAVPPRFVGDGNYGLDQANANILAGRAINAITAECLRSKGYVPHTVEGAAQ